MKFRVLLAALALSACQTMIPAPQTPAQTVFLAKGTFLIAVGVANRYKALPPCPMVVVCSSPAVVAVLQKSANATDAILDSAETTVRDPAFANTDAAGKAALAATNAVSALQAITAGLRVQ